MKYRNTPEKSTSKGCVRSLSQAKTMCMPSSAFADTWYVPGDSLMPAAHLMGHTLQQHMHAEQTMTSRGSLIGSWSVDSSTPDLSACAIAWLRTYVIPLLPVGVEKMQHI